MMHSTNDFDYELPPALIAQTPLDKRDESRLLVCDKATGQIFHKHFFDIVDYLHEGDVLVVNDTKVIPARLYGNKESGGAVEFLLHKRLNATEWEVLCKPGKRLQVGVVVGFGDRLKAQIIKHNLDGSRIVRFDYQGIFEEVLESVGTMPLPPYIKAKLKDKDRYQTVYNTTGESAAAPTAGLHFTKSLLQKLQQKGVIVTKVNLTVGLGTFRPVKVDDLTKHDMHSEFYTVPQETADIVNLAKKEKRRVIAVGTTSVRALESCARQTGVCLAKSESTDIFIYPPYDFLVVDGLVTNFHLPKSTLLMLVSAFWNKENTMQLYQTAIQEKYRFFSFGDAMLILP